MRSYAKRGNPVRSHEALINMTGPARSSRTALLALLATSTLASAHAATVWVPTATKALAVSQLLSATDLGAMPSTRPITVRVGLAIQQKAALNAYIWAEDDPKSAAYGKFLTPAQFARYYGPSAAQIASVTTYLKNAGFTNIVAEPNGLLISATGTAAMAQTAFNTKLEMVSMAGQSLFINTAAASVPSSLGGLVVGVLGLNSVGQMKPFAKHVTAASSATASPAALPTPPQYAVSYTPKQFQTIYNAADTGAACCTVIGLITEGNMAPVISDLRIAEKAFGLPQSPVGVVTVGLASPDVSGQDEWDLDSQYSTGMANSVKELLFYTTTSLTDSDLALDFSRVVTDDRARAASASLGECEVFPYIDGSMVIDDEMFNEGAAQGQTFFASAGDTGSFCPVSVVGVNGVPAGAPFVNYPASSPYVVAVGGTTLLTNADGSYSSEVAWYAGGGGLSQFETSPYWQQAAVTALATTGDRGVPDIAYDADPESGAQVYVNGVEEGVGGTSLSSPLALGAWARVLNKDWKVGYASPLLYSLYDGTGVTGTYPEGGFHDILLGANGAYTAGPGYDLTTGLGTIIVDQLVTDLGK